MYTERGVWIRWAEHVICGASLGYLAGVVLPNLGGVVLCVLFLMKRSDVKILSSGDNTILNALGILIYLLTFSCVPIGAILAVQVSWVSFLPFLFVSAPLWLIINMALDDWE